MNIHHNESLQNSNTSANDSLTYKPDDEKSLFSKQVLSKHDDGNLLFSKQASILSKQFLNEELPQHLSECTGLTLMLLHQLDKALTNRLLLW